MNDKNRLIERIQEVTGRPVSRPPTVVTDTSDPMRIMRGQVMRVGGHDFVIEGNRYETRFGIADQPKYWVFSAIDLDSGDKKIIKTEFHEDFHVHIGVFRIHCYRSPDKETEVLELVQGDSRFMQGYSIRDEKGNNIRVIDFIPGRTIFQHVYGIDKTHRRYFEEELPGILYKLVSSMEAIQFLHDNSVCHGDIRNDHIIIESATGAYRWIDFDLKQHVSDFDVWSVGNILGYVIGKGINSFRVVLKSPEFSDEVKNSLRPEDGSAFYEYRVMNLKKLYPYIPERLNDILRHFTIQQRGSYGTVRELIDEFCEMLASEFPSAPSA